MYFYNNHLAPKGFNTLYMISVIIFYEKTYIFYEGNYFDPNTLTNSFHPLSINNLFVNHIAKHNMFSNVVNKQKKLLYHNVVWIHHFTYISETGTYACRCSKQNIG